jgi:hypothetical protein
LKNLCKSYERNKKSEKEKEENKIKMEKGRGKRFGPTPEASRGPVSKPEPVCCVFPLPR